MSEASAPTVDEVGDCDECPYSYRSPPLAGGWRCIHPAVCPPGADDPPRRRLSMLTDDGASGPPPDWCPLRKAPTIVRLRHSIDAMHPCANCGYPLAGHGEGAEPPIACDDYRPAKGNANGR